MSHVLKLHTNHADIVLVQKKSTVTKSKNNTEPLITSPPPNTTVNSSYKSFTKGSIGCDANDNPISLLPSTILDKFLEGVEGLDDKDDGTECSTSGSASPISKISSASSSVYGSDTDEEFQPLGFSPLLHFSKSSTQSDPSVFNLDALNSYDPSIASTGSGTNTSAENCLGRYLGGFDAVHWDPMLGASSRSVAPYGSYTSTSEITQPEQTPQPHQQNGGVKPGLQPQNAPQEPITCSSLFNLVPNELTTQSSTHHSVTPDGSNTSKTPQPQPQPHQQVGRVNLGSQPLPNPISLQLQQQQQIQQIQLQQIQQIQLQQQQQLQQLQQIQQIQQIQQLQQLQQRHLIYQKLPSPVVTLLHPNSLLACTPQSSMRQPDSSGPPKIVVIEVVRDIDMWINGNKFVYSGEVGPNKLPYGKGIFIDKFGNEYSGNFKFFSSVDNEVKCKNRDTIQFGRMVNGVFYPQPYKYTQIKTTKTCLTHGG
jgi:hypothetical protein